jgi:hypothetical protein
MVSKSVVLSITWGAAQIGNRTRDPEVTGSQSYPHWHRDSPLQDICLSLGRFMPILTHMVLFTLYGCLQNAKNIGHFSTPLKPHNIGTHLKGIETSFQVVPLFLKSFHFWVSYITFWNFLKIPSVFKGLIPCRF